MHLVVFMYVRKSMELQLEILALVWVVRLFRPYLLGHKTTVYTDHSASTSLLKAPHPLPKLARWAIAIQDFDLDIKYCQGRSNSNEDALSWNLVISAAVLMVESNK